MNSFSALCFHVLRFFVVFFTLFEISSAFFVWCLSYINCFALSSQDYPPTDKRYAGRGTSPVAQEPYERHPKRNRILYFSLQSYVAYVK
ncbi:hypothetical protein BDP27DRAFT_450326 [Rhodocollybia butyracea]|uniref:Uncharacterized protein n=1 Tax=Rhodocollybia butyracea TaxID=206335 RepID=A0A9P5PAF6_9AGAR|nr:hypothetical protein BDP27DRAFT_450326 [Rhodocollybia butyracea]